MHPAHGRLNPGPGPGEAHLQAAVQWYLLLHDAEVSAEQRGEWQCWLDASPEHARAWARIERLQQQLHGVPRDVAMPVLSSLGIQRRQGLKLALLLAAGAASFGGYRASPYSVDFATRTGERRQVTLADGSSLELNTDTRVDIVFDEHERVIHLRQGEIFVTTATDRAPPRPLSVETPHGRVLALGTRFDVRLEQGFSTVAVQAHAVEVRPRDKPLLSQRIEAGQALTFGSAELGRIRTAASEDNAWTRGLLVAIDWRLDDFLRELSRYRPGYLGCAEAVSALRISGAFRLDDIDGVLANLPVSLPVRLRRFSRYWTWVEAV